MSGAPDGALDSGGGWQDHSLGDDALSVLVEKIGEQQRRIAASAASQLNGVVDRGQHQKRLLAARGTLHIGDAVPSALRHGPFAAPLDVPVACRFSNGQPCSFADTKADVRGLAVKFFAPPGMECDMLVTNQGGRSHARDAEQFMAFADVLVAQIENGGRGALEELREELGAHELSIAEILRIAGVLFRETTLHGVKSLATEHFWGSVVELGGAAFKYSLHPDPDTPAGPSASDPGGNYLRDDLLRRLSVGPLKWRLAVQLFVDEETTPVGDASVAWAGEPVEIGELVISAVPTMEDERTIDRMAFNPAHGFEPLGITHARKAVYAASARNRSGRGLIGAEEARRYIESPTA